MSEARILPTEPAGAPLQLRLEAFRGPLDLLLHLVRTGALDVAAIPLVEVARQCDEYLALLQEVGWDEAGDHLVMAATLVHMKSRSLLPPDPAALAASPDEAVDGSFRPEARARGMRQAAEELQEREAVMELVYSRPAGRVAEFAGEQAIEADLFALLNAFQTVLRRVGADPAARITRERVSLVDRIAWLVETLHQKRRVSFRDLFEDATDRLSCILTFLALLEVIRLRLARAYSSHGQEDILIVLAGEAAPAAAPAEEVPADA